MSRGLSAPEVAKLLDKSKDCIYRYEWDQNEPTLADLGKMARLYGVTVALLVDPRHAKGKFPVAPSPYPRGPAEVLETGDDSEQDRDAAA